MSNFNVMPGARCLLLKGAKTWEEPRWVLDQGGRCLKVCSPYQLALFVSRTTREKVVILHFGRKNLPYDSDFPALGLVVFSSLSMNQNPVCSWRSHSWIKYQTPLVAKGHLWSQREVVQAIVEEEMGAIGDGAPAHHRDPREVMAIQYDLLSHTLS